MDLRPSAPYSVPLILTMVPDIITQMLVSSLPANEYSHISRRMPVSRATGRRDAPPKSLISRTRTGCIGCRLRRKKCDEQRPFCRGCLRNGLLCTWPDDNPGRAAELLSRKKTTVVKKYTVQSSSNIGGWELSGAAGRYPHHTEGNDASRMQPASPAFDSQIMGILGSIHQSLCFQPLHGKSNLSQPMSRVLFDHYIHRTTKILSVFQGAINPFLVKLLPIAMSHDLVLQSLLAFSGVHYNYLNGTLPCQTSLLHYGIALKQVKHGLTSIAQGEQTIALPLLAAALILCTLEVCTANYILKLISNILIVLSRRFWGFEYTSSQRRSIPAPDMSPFAGIPIGRRYTDVYY